MNNELAKKILAGVSALVGIVVAGSIYKTALRAVDEPELIGDGEIICDEVKDFE